MTDKELREVLVRLRKGRVIPRDIIERLVLMAQTHNMRNAEAAGKPANPAVYPSHAPQPPTAQPYTGSGQIP